MNGLVVHWIFTKWWRPWDQGTGYTNPLNKVQDILTILSAHLQLYSCSRWSLSPLCASMYILESLSITKTPAGISNETILNWNVNWKVFRLVFFSILNTLKNSLVKLFEPGVGLCVWGGGQEGWNCKCNSFISCGSIQIFWCFLCPFC